MKDFPFFSCDGCHGYLVGTKRVANINKRRTLSQQQLNQAIVQSDGRDHTGRIRCPRCQRPMEKRPCTRKSKFQLDHCGDCNLVWFDSGELAQLQIDHEATPQAQEAARLQNRHRQMTAKEKHAFERDLANLPEGTATYLAGFTEGIASVGMHLWRHRR